MPSTASSWASGMFREPLRGEACELPVRLDQGHPVLGYRDVIDRHGADARAKRVFAVYKEVMREKGLID